MNETVSVRSALQYFLCLAMIMTPYDIINGGQILVYYQGIRNNAYL